MIWPVFKLHFRRHRRLYLVLAVIVLVVAAIGGHHALAQTSGQLSAKAQSNPDPTQKFYAWLGDGVLVLVQLVANLTALMVHLLVLVAGFNSFIDVPLVKTGWALMRDITNMFFIIALLIVAAGTILRIENYRYNRLLARIILMAFLVNFSRLIAGFLIQTAQVVMLTFVNAFKDVLFGNFASMFGLDQVLSFANNTNTFAGGIVDFGIVLMSLFGGLALMIVAAMVTLALLLMLMVRIVALWILIILSPFAYALRILPNTEGYARQWWTQFGRYVTVGPVLAFFLWAALALVASTGSTEISGLGAPASGTPDEQVSQFSPFVSELLSVEKLASFMISIIFLVLAMNYASGAGVAGGRAIGRFSQGAVLGASGVSWVRDRTIAPVQGWIRNRQSAQRARIQDRTQTLEAGLARMREAVPIAPIPGMGRAGQERAAAVARQYDRQRGQRVAQERGYQDMNEAELQQRFQTGRLHERMGALGVLQQRGRVNLQDAGQNAAYQWLTNSTNTRGRVPAGQVRQWQEDVLGGNARAWNADQVRARLNTTTDRHERDILINALEQKRALSADQAGDVALTNELRTSLSDAPQRLREFEDGLRRANPRMALETIYNGFRAGRQNVDRYLNDAQQGLVNTANLTSRDVAGMVVGLRNNNGMGRRQGRDYISNNLLQNARSREEYNRLTDSMPYGVRHMINSGVNVDPATTREKRDWLAYQGYGGEAYRGQANEDAIMQNYVNDNAVRVAELARTGRLSRQTIQQQTAMRNMMDNRRIGRRVLNEMADTNPEMRDAARDSALQVVYAQNTAVDAGGNPIAVADDSEQGRLQNNRREVLLDLAQGSNVVNPQSGQEANVLDVAIQGVPVQQQRQNFRRRAIRRQLGNWRRLQFPGTLSEESRQDIVLNATVGQLNQLADQNPDTARSIAEIAYHNNIDWNAGDQIEGHTLTKQEADALNAQHKNLQRSDRGLV